ncbi:MAG: amidase family protein, partial [Nitriliruptorales bacterium]|nr:amidase family protein [Nitriliruptorales bacterium]
HDHVLVQRLRDAGAIVVGLTTLPELAVFGATTSRFGTTRNPWNLDYTTAGSSGGSAAAVAAGMVPIALASDGLGSIRLPAAAAGIVGIKPGRGVVPQAFAGSWFGMSQFGPVARTVADTALMLDVLADTPGQHASVEPPSTPIRAALSTAVPLRPGSISREWKQAARDAADVLRGAGHIVTEASPRYPASLPVSVLARWSQGTLENAQLEGVEDFDQLEPRHRTLVGIGQRWRSRRPVTPAAADAWHDALDAFLSEHQLLLTPTMARRPLPAEPWHERSWIANLAANAPRYPMTGPFNLADVPAASVPMGHDRGGVPVAVQVVGRRGHEADVLAVAALLERERPWQRIATGFEPADGGRHLG